MYRSSAAKTQKRHGDVIRYPSFLLGSLYTQTQHGTEEEEEEEEQEEDEEDEEEQQQQQKKKHATLLIWHRLPYEKKDQKVIDVLPFISFTGILYFLFTGILYFSSYPLLWCGLTYIQTVHTYDVVSSTVS